MKVRVATSYFSSPSDGFVINENSNNSIDVGISDYDYNSTITQVRLEYAAWSDDDTPPSAFTNSNIVLAKTDLVNNQPPLTLDMWDTDGLPDGKYSIRLILQSGTCISYSTRVIGILDRTDPSVLGVAYPIDDDYESGDIIGVTFDEEIDCNAAMTVSLIMSPGDVIIPATITCDSIELEIAPSYDISTEIDKTFTVTVDGVTDLYGNVADPVSWIFTVGNTDSDNDGVLDQDEDCIGSSLTFQDRGINSTADYVEVPYDTDLSVTDGDFSFQAWVYTEDNAVETRTIISKGTVLGEPLILYFPY